MHRGKRAACEVWSHRAVGFCSLKFAEGSLSGAFQWWRRRSFDRDLDRDFRRRFDKGFVDVFRLPVDRELSLRRPYCLAVVPASGGSIVCSGRQALSSATPRPFSGQEQAVIRRRPIGVPSALARIVGNASNVRHRILSTAYFEPQWRFDKGFDKGSAGPYREGLNGGSIGVHRVRLAFR